MVVESEVGGALELTDDFVLNEGLVLLLGIVALSLEWVFLAVGVALNETGPDIGRNSERDVISLTVAGEETTRKKINFLIPINSLAYCVQYLLSIHVLTEE